MAFRLICHMTQNIFLNILGGYPRWGGGGAQDAPPPPNFGSKYENISHNQCPCRKSASYLIWCGHAPLSKTVTKKDFPVIFSC